MIYNGLLIMNKILALILATVAVCANAHEITAQEYSQLFKNYDACFILYDLNADKIVTEYNSHNRCNEQIAPDSTFKIPLSLMAFDRGIINQNTVFKWDGKKSRAYPDWNHDQTPKSWLQYTVVWVSQQITPQLGYSTIKYYLADFHYGNQDFSGDPGKNNGLTHAWLSSSLKISAVEQLNFLKTMSTHQLSITPEAIENTEKNLYQGKLNCGADYYGKTGSGRHGRNEREKTPSKLREGWYIGFVEQKTRRYIFVSNLTDRFPAKTNEFGNLTPAGSSDSKAITIKLLNDYFSECFARKVNENA